MSEFELTIGKIQIPEIEEACVKHLVSIGLARKRFFRPAEGPDLGWRESESSIDNLSLLNLASVSLFLDHVSALEGLIEPREKIEKTQFKHLPWYMEVVWLPVDFEKAALISMPEGSPLPILSLQALLRNLESLRTISNSCLGDVPQGYDLMRADLMAFNRADFNLPDNQSVLQWVWRGLFDGANLALKHNIPMYGNTL